MFQTQNLIQENKKIKACRTILLFFCFLINFYQIDCSYQSISPTLVSNDYFRSGSGKVVIQFLQDSGRSFNFTYSTAFSAAPKLVYGIKNIQSEDQMIRDEFMSFITYQSQTEFQYQVQVYGWTTILDLDIHYLAVDQLFPLYLRFDISVQLFTSSMTTNQISTDEVVYSVVDTYSFYASYNQQNNFSEPLSSNKVVFFLTGFKLNSDVSDTMKFTFEYSILNQTNYQYSVRIKSDAVFSSILFSKIIYNNYYPQPSNRYSLISQRWEVQTGLTFGFFTFPQQYKDSMILGLTDFDFTSGNCGIQYFWETKINFNGSKFGLYINQSIPDSLRSITNCGFSATRSQLFYAKKWLCPSPLIYYNRTTNQCQDGCSDYFYLDTVNASCNPCHYSCMNCIASNQSAACTKCETSSRRTLQNGSCICSVGFYDDGSKLDCQMCPLYCDKCFSSNTCQTCTQTQITKKYIDDLCYLCEIEGCLMCSGHNSCSSCEKIYSLQAANCVLCSENCDCDGWTLPRVNNACTPVCGDNLLRGFEQCDDGVFFPKSQCLPNCLFYKQEEVLLSSSSTQYFSLSLFVIGFRIVGMEALHVFQTFQLLLESSSIKPFNLSRNINGYTDSNSFPMDISPDKILLTFFNFTYIFLVALFAVGAVLYLVSKIFFKRHSVANNSNETIKEAIHEPTTKAMNRQRQNNSINLKYQTFQNFQQIDAQRNLSLQFLWWGEGLSKQAFVDLLANCQNVFVYGVVRQFVEFSEKSSVSFLEIIVIISMVVLAILMLVFIKYESQNFGENHLKFFKGKEFIYWLLIFGQKTVISLLIAVNKNETLYAVLCVKTIFVVFYCYAELFFEKIQKFRSLTTHFLHLALIFLFVLNEKVFKPKETMIHFSPFFIYFFYLALLSLVLLICLVFYIRQIYKKGAADYRKEIENLANEDKINQKSATIKIIANESGNTKHKPQIKGSSSKFISGSKKSSQRAKTISIVSNQEVFESPQPVLRSRKIDEKNQFGTIDVINLQPNENKNKGNSKTANNIKSQRRKDSQIKDYTEESKSYAEDKVYPKTKQDLKEKSERKSKKESEKEFRSGKIQFI